MKNLLITGGNGFIGSNLIRRFIHQREKYKIITVDKLVYPHCKSNIYYNKFNNSYIGDICDSHFINRIFEIEKPDYVINLAAYSFVDEAISGAIPFVETNIKGVQVLIDASVKYGIEKFVQVSTDEVFGQLNLKEDPWTETSLTNPRNPYSASKLAGELMLQAAGITHGLNYNITRCCNNFGPRQLPRNFLPKAIKNILEKTRMPIYNRGEESRSWIYVDDHIDAIQLVLEKGLPSNIYNVDAGHELNNIELFHKITKIMNEGLDLFEFVEDRKGHDKRYACNSMKLRDLGWKPESKFIESLESTISWYVANQWWFKV